MTLAGVRPEGKGLRRNRQPLPSGIFIAGLPQVGITRETLPRTMTGGRRDTRNVPSDFEQAGNAIMPQIVKVEIFDQQKLTGPGKAGADGIGAVGKYLRSDLRHRENDLQRLRRKVAPDIVADFLAGILHVPNQHATALRVEIFPDNTRNLFLPAR